ncbi:hypothetical protein N0V88_008216 [Collariella sp. IMI 366227]|nr:hypothetical protein N0V88_008216 [Collariella sp. IMI 366227]
MDAEKGVQLLRLVDPDVTVPIHIDDYDVFCSPLEDFIKEVEAAGFGDKVVYLDKGDKYRFANSTKNHAHYITDFRSLCPEALEPKLKT